MKIFLVRFTFREFFFLFSVGVLASECSTHKVSIAEENC